MRNGCSWASSFHLRHASRCIDRFAIHLTLFRIANILANAGKMPASDYRGVA